MTTNFSQTSNVPDALIRALFDQPETLQQALDRAGLAPHHLAIWARQNGIAEIEKLAGWLSVGRDPRRFKPLLEVAASHLRAGELLDALPVFRWAYQCWLSAPDRVDGAGVKLLTQWGECLYRLERSAAAQARWLLALDVAPDAETLKRLVRTMEQLGALQECRVVLDEARRLKLEGAEALWQRRQQVDGRDGVLTPTAGATTAGATTADATTAPLRPGGEMAPGVAVMADVANLDMLCGEQYGYHRRLDYGRLAQDAARYGPLRAQAAFVPDIPETQAVRAHLSQVGFEIDLKRPKRSHGRFVANADTAMAATAVRWASRAEIGRLELWTGDGDFCKVREVVREAWPEVRVVFRCLEAGTAAAIRRLEADWIEIGPEMLL